MPGVQGGASAHAGWTVVRHECSSHRFLDPSYLHPICHNFTLQHDRLQSVTTTATKQKIQGELRRIPIPRTRVNKAKGVRLRTTSCSLTTCVACRQRVADKVAHRSR